MGLLNHPSKLSFPMSCTELVEVSPQLAFQGNFVNPLETDAIGSISNRLLFGFCLRSCFTTPKPQTKLNRLTVWWFLENARVRRIRSQKRLVPHHYLFTPLPHTCPVAIGSSFNQYQAQKPPFHSFHSNTLRRFVPHRPTLFFVPFIHAVFRAFSPNPSGLWRCKSFVPQHLLSPYQPIKPCPPPKEASPLRNNILPFPFSRLSIIIQTTTKVTASSLGEVGGVYRNKSNR